MVSELGKLKEEMQSLADRKQSGNLSRFFKTAKGEYGEGDVFLGLMVPVQRKLVKKYNGLSLSDIKSLMASKYHEHRLVALLILAQRYSESDEEGRKTIYNLYLQLAAAGRVNNWDLVDMSAPSIAGDYAFSHKSELKTLRKLAKSANLWQRRIAILSMFRFIRAERMNEPLEFAEILVNDEHDLIQKAVGWMLREIGKRDQPAEETFLRKHCSSMPRTMLRYAIERFSPEKKKFYMS